MRYFAAAANIRPWGAGVAVGKEAQITVHNIHAHEHRLLNYYLQSARSCASHVAAATHGKLGRTRHTHTLTHTHIHAISGGQRHWHYPCASAHRCPHLPLPTLPPSFAPIPPPARPPSHPTNRHVQPLPPSHLSLCVCKCCQQRTGCGGACRAG
jgi:hypothetical protein